MHTDEPLQCHPYLIEAGNNSVLVDPGSATSIDALMDQVVRVIALDQIRWIVCHHSDPDIAGGLARLGTILAREDVTVVTEWRTETLLRYYGHRFPVMLIEEHDWCLELDDERELRFVLTPYLHFPGAMCSYETSSQVLFSSDLFGGFTDGKTLYATDSSHFEVIRSFHEHYMPSREILRAGLGRIRRAFPSIALIAPQHGCIIPSALIDEMFTGLEELECGIFLLAQQDVDVARLLRVSAAIRRVTDALVMAHDFPELAATTERVLPDLLPVRSMEIFVDTTDEGWLRFGDTDNWVGSATPGPPTPFDPFVEFQLPGEGEAAKAIIQLSEAVDVTDEVREVLNQLGPALRVALDRHLILRSGTKDRVQLDRQAHRDSLTGLFNRRALEELPVRGHHYAVLMVDIDHFKLINDRFGHSAGDQALMRVAACISQGIRAQDVAVRFGGDEFLVLLKNSNEALASKIAARVRLAVATAEAASGLAAGPIGLSIGISIHSGALSLAPAIALADAALYEAKREGRDQTVVATEARPYERAD